MTITRREALTLGTAAGIGLVGSALTRAQQNNVERAIAESTAQLFFSGGHGGLVTYYGTGGALTKEGGPIDRLFLLRGERLTYNLGGDIGLDIRSGTCRIRTGPLARDVRIAKATTGDTLVYFYFEGNDDEAALEIVGGIAELDLANDTVLFSSSVEPGEMVWMRGDVTGKQPMLPFTALHWGYYVHPAILERFELRLPDPRLGLTAWCGTAQATWRWWETDTVEMSFDPEARYGSAFRTSQHLANLRLFL